MKVAVYSCLTYMAQHTDLAQKRHTNPPTSMLPPKELLLNVQHH